MARWWRDTAAEIHAAIPDFGGFLVKADSEGQPGPQDYGRSHAEGANTLAAALAPHGGLVIWRAFVYESGVDRARDAYDSFHPLDGAFAENVLVQVKNGPIDFQVREPVSPLFGGMPRTPLVGELQVTQEYTGHSTHLCYLVPQWKTALDAAVDGAGATVKDVLDGSRSGYGVSGLAGVANVGDDRNWCGHHLAAANLHGFGRLAWNPDLAADDLAEEWTRMTFGPQRAVVDAVRSMLLGSWRTYEDYTSPLGVGVICEGGAHFDPAPAIRTSYHRADAERVGFDRTQATGSGYTGQYAPPVGAVFESLGTCPDELLLFFHHVPYRHRLGSGTTVIQHIYDTHFDGVEQAEDLRATWERLDRVVDARRHAEVRERLDAQVAHAVLWRDVINAYFRDLSGIDDEQGRLALRVTDVGVELPLLSGVAGAVDFTVTNDGEDAAPVEVALAVPEGWASAPFTQEVPPGGTAVLRVPVTPPARPATATLTATATTPDGVVTGGGTTIDVIAAPSGDTVPLALDGGSAGGPVLPTYDRLAPEDTWPGPAGRYGWVGAAPTFRDRDGLDDLRRDFVLGRSQAVRAAGRSAAGPPRGVRAHRRPPLAVRDDVRPGGRGRARLVRPRDHPAGRLRVVLVPARRRDVPADGGPRAGGLAARRLLARRCRGHADSDIGDDPRTARRAERPTGRRR